MDQSRQLAIKECLFNGIRITGNEFDKLLREYNNFEMPLSKRCERIVNKEEPEFFIFLKNKIIQDSQFKKLKENKIVKDLAIEWWNSLGDKTGEIADKYHKGCETIQNHQILEIYFKEILKYNI